MSSYKRRTRRKDSSVAYSVYIFYRPEHQNDNYVNHVPWEKRHTTSNIKVAYRQAEDLFNSRAYERVEIKKIFFDTKIERKIDKTLKIYKESAKRPVGMLMFPLLHFADVCSSVLQRLRPVKTSP